MFQEEISIWISGLSKEDSPPQRGWTYQIHWELNRTKRWRKAESTLYLTTWVWTSIFYSQHSWFSGLRLSLESTPSAFRVPLALFLWKTLTNTPSLTALMESLCESKTNTKYKLRDGNRFLVMIHECLDPTCLRYYTPWLSSTMNQYIPFLSLQPLLVQFSSLAQTNCNTMRTYHSEPMYFT